MAANLSYRNQCPRQLDRDCMYVETIGCPICSGYNEEIRRKAVDDTRRMAQQSGASNHTGRDKDVIRGEGGQVSQMVKPEGS